VRRAAFAAIFAIACAGPPPRDRCERRIDAIAERLAIAAEHGEPAGAPPDVELVPGRGGVPLEGTPPLLVVGDEVSLAGRGVGGGDDVSAIAETLRGDLELLTDLSESTVTVALWVDPNVEAGRLVDLLAGAPERVRFAFLVHATDVTTRPEPAWLTEMLGHARVDPIDRRARLSRSWANAANTCAAAELPLPTETLGAPSPDALVRALRDCGCEDTRLHTIEALATAALLGADGPIARLPNVVRFGPPSDEGPDIAVARSTPMRELVRDRTLLARSRHVVWITVE
jgi:hypothetical protein